MSELELWRWLREGDPTSPRLVELLDRYARRIVWDRFPLFGALGPALVSPAPAVRAAALRVLGGAEGAPAVRHLVAALDDPDPSVRDAAARALAETARGTPSRWAHAVFHPDPGVRRLALAYAPTRETASLAAFLLADPECAADVVARLEAPRAGQPRVRLTRTTEIAALDLAARGALARDLAARVVALVSAGSLGRWIVGARRRGGDEVISVLDAARDAAPGPACAPTHDALDGLVPVLWDAPDALARRAARALYDACAGVDAPSPRDVARRVAAAVVAECGRRGALSPAAAAACALLDLRSLAWPWLDAAARGAMCDAVLARAAPIQALVAPTDDELDALLASLARRPLDLRAVAAAVRAREAAAYDALRARVGDDALLDAIARDGAGAVALLAWPGTEARERVALLRAARARAPDGGAALLASVVLASRGGEWADVAVASEGAAADLVAELASRPAATGEPAPLAALEFVPRALDRDASARALAACLERADPRTNARALEAVFQLAIGFTAEDFAPVARALPLPALRALLAALDVVRAVPYAHEALLPDALRDHDDPVVAAWVAARTPPPAAAPARAPSPADDAARAWPAPVRPDGRALARARVKLRGIAGMTDDEASAAIAAASDPAAVAPYLRDGRDRVVQDAVLRLVELGEDGLARLVAALAGPSPAALDRVVDSVPLWPDGPALRGLAALACAAETPPEVRFRVALALVERGGRFESDRDALLAAAVDAARAPSPRRWFRPADYDLLVTRRGSARLVAVALAGAEQYHAWKPAADWLATHGEAGADDVQAAIREVLARDRRRPWPLRRQLARSLVGHADVVPTLPIHVADFVADASAPMDFLAHVKREHVTAVADAWLYAGDRLAREYLLGDLLRAEAPWEEGAREEAAERLLADSLTDDSRRLALTLQPVRETRAVKLRRVALAFAWGNLVAQELTGRPIKIEMTAGRGLGFTRIGEDRIWVTPLPIVRRERHGREVVEALILHELGHIVYHRSAEATRVWKEAAKEGIGGLLNLVADEHLERNLRAYDPEYGDRLKRLAAYAFQHGAREVPLGKLLASLNGRAAEVLTRAGIGVAREPAAVRVDAGAVLLAMETAGMSFPRFVRALRMGLGNRHNDPRVEEALGLFRKGFRRQTMAGLREIARRLRELFGWEAALCETFGTGEGLACDGAEAVSASEDLSDAEVQTEIKKITDPARIPGRADRNGGAGGGMWLNAVGEERFDTITRVEPVPHDPAAHRAYADRVARHARTLRRYFSELGLSYRPERFRLTGRRFDATRARAVVLRGDPRMLVARRLEVDTDLFLGVVIDCSGSMGGNDNIEKARLVGTMLAEAARGLEGIDLRVWGFTDQVVYDAGDAGRCAAHALQAGGGNNDAGALWHAAQVAHKSRRRAKLLVMVSDGLPTECTVASLKALVARLGRRYKMHCAQVAVQPLEEVCFPHYVLVDTQNLDAVVRQFGAVIARLVRTATARS